MNLFVVMKVWVPEKFVANLNFLAHFFQLAIKSQDFLILAAWLFYHTSKTREIILLEWTLLCRENYQYRQHFDVRNNWLFHNLSLAIFHEKKKNGKYFIIKWADWINQWLFQ